MSSTMIKETGRVVAVDGDSIWVEITPRSACSSCNIGAGCGTSVLARWFGRHSNCIRVPNRYALQQNDTALIGISDQALLKAALLAYMLPVLGMVVAAMLAAGAGAADSTAGLCSIIGLAAGLWLVRKVSQREELQPQAQLLRQTPQSVTNN